MSSPRVGVGVDVHPFDSMRPLRLAGVDWPDEPGLSGHSDGDAAAHALADAILSAAGLGDLGAVIGVDEPRWSGASGIEILQEVARRVRSAGCTIGNASVQVIGNRPKVASRRTDAESALSAAIDAVVSVSATTSDGLGLTGRDEGIAAIAVAIVFAD